MKQRITDCFAKAKAEGHGAFVAYMTIGYPTLEKSEASVETLISEGADIIELGVPFSDPFADGAVIRSAAYEALRQGVTLDDVLAKTAITLGLVAVVAIATFMMIPPAKFVVCLHYREISEKCP